MSRLLIIAGTCLGLLAGALFFFLSSPWLTWELLPASGVRIVADTRLPHFEQQWQVVSPYIAPTAAVHTGSALDRAVYAVQHWSWPAMRTALRRIIVAPVPLQPVAVVQLENTLADPLLAIATAHQGTVRWLLVDDEIRLKDRPLPDQAQVYDWAAEMDLAVVVPGEVLAQIPSALRDQWNIFLHEHLGFVHTKPRIIETLAEFERIYIYGTGDNLALGVLGSKANQQQWSKQVEQWVVDEERYGRPVEQAFRLPDGTVGRELVPGLAGDVWRKPDSGGCRAPLPQKTTLWLCEMGQQTLVATSPDLLKAPILSDQQWLMAGRGRWLEPLSLTSVMARGQGDRTTVQIVY